MVEYPDCHNFLIRTANWIVNICDLRTPITINGGCCMLWEVANGEDYVF